ncbi:hypothetical protein BKA93DRAFT_749818 [Sparassis latifolia]
MALMMHPGTTTPAWPTSKPPLLPFHIGLAIALAGNDALGVPSIYGHIHAVHAMSDSHIQFFVQGDHLSPHGFLCVPSSWAYVGVLTRLTFWFHPRELTMALPNPPLPPLSNHSSFSSPSPPTATVARLFPIHPSLFFPSGGPYMLGDIDYLLKRTRELVAEEMQLHAQSSLQAEAAVGESSDVTHPSGDQKATVIPATL